MPPCKRQALPDHPRGPRLQRRWNSEAAFVRQPLANPPRGAPWRASPQRAGPRSRRRGRTGEESFCQVPLANLGRVHSRPDTESVFGSDRPAIR